MSVFAMLQVQSPCGAKKTELKNQIQWGVQVWKSHPIQFVRWEIKETVKPVLQSKQYNNLHHTVTEHHFSQTVTITTITQKAKNKQKYTKIKSSET